MEKKVRIVFKSGEIFEIATEKVAQLIAERFFTNFLDDGIIKDIINNKSVILEFIWDLPWNEISSVIDEKIIEEWKCSEAVIICS